MTGTACSPQPDAGDESYVILITIDGFPHKSFELGPVARDLAWTGTAVHLIRERCPNVMLFHLLNVDWTHHRFGKGNNPGYTALAYADANIRMVLEEILE